MKGLYQRQLRLVLPYRKKILLAMLCMAVAAGCATASLYLIKPVFNELIVNKDKQMLDMLCIAVLIVYAVKGACLCGNAYLMNYVSQKIITVLRGDVYKHIQHLPVPDLDKMETGNLMSRITGDVGALQNTLSSSVTGVVMESFTFVGCIFIMFYMDWRLATISMTIVPLAFMPIFKVGKMLRKISSRTQQATADISVIMHETIGGNRIVKAFGMEAHEEARFRGENERLLRFAMKSVLISAINSASMEFLGGVGIVAIMLYGGYRIIDGKMTGGSLFSFLAAMISLYTPVKRLASYYASIQQGLAAAERVYDILDQPVEVVEQPVGKASGSHQAISGIPGRLLRLRGKAGALRHKLQGGSRPGHGAGRYERGGQDHPRKPHPQVL